MVSNQNNMMRFRRQEYSNMYRSTCTCPKASGKTWIKDNKPLNEFPVAMAYVPWQKWKNIYEIQKGFKRGTIFEELDKIFQGRGGCNR